eukprot:364876-Chlamydomonas_euryale.AAC.11
MDSIRDAQRTTFFKRTSTPNCTLPPYHPGPNSDTATPQHRNAAAPQHRNASTPQRRNTATPHRRNGATAQPRDTASHEPQAQHAPTVPAAHTAQTTSRPHPPQQSCITPQPLATTSASHLTPYS